MGAGVHSSAVLKKCVLLRFIWVFVQLSTGLKVFCILLHPDQKLVDLQNFLTDFSSYSICCLNFFLLTRYSLHI